MNSCNKYKYSKSQKKTKNKKPRKFKWTMYISKFKSKTCTFNTFFAETSMWLAWFYRSLRLCSHFMDKFYSKIIMLCSDLSTQPAECSRMKCPHLIERDTEAVQKYATWHQLQKKRYQQCQGWSKWEKDHCNWALLEMEIWKKIFLAQLNLIEFSSNYVVFLYVDIFSRGF